MNLRPECVAVSSIPFYGTRHTFHCRRIPFFVASIILVTILLIYCRGIDATNALHLRASHWSLANCAHNENWPQKCSNKKVAISTQKNAAKIIRICGDCRTIQTQRRSKKWRTQTARFTNAPHSKFSTRFVGLQSIVCVCVCFCFLFCALVYGFLSLYHRAHDHCARTHTQTK